MNLLDVVLGLLVFSTGYWLGVIVGVRVRDTVDE